MKKNNTVAAIIVLSVTGLLISYFSINAIMGDINKKTVTFREPNNVTNEISAPDPEVFNSAAVNPTIEVFIGACVDSNQNGILEPIEKLECNSPDSRKRVNESEAKSPKPPEKATNEKPVETKKPESNPSEKKPDNKKPDNETNDNKAVNNPSASDQSFSNPPTSTPSNSSDSSPDDSEEDLDSEDEE